ncbi:MAG: right-handed parallel beta-helix repeat-containing protein [Thermoplasmata archaeon]|nr:MAG: right-handed parallel beta-helix repeat-containing protein [Thermoplasmata archaeon]
MNKKIIAVWVSLAMVFGLIVIVDVTLDFSIRVGGSTLYVNITGSGGAYTSIQDAINDSKDGDTVFVYNGTYYENVVVNRTINLIGENKNNTIIDSNGSDDVILIMSGWVNVSGFSVRNSGRKGEIEIDSGFELNSGNNTISDNLIYNNYYGLYLYFSNDNHILKNIINSSYGSMYIMVSSNNNIEENIISNTTAGIGLYWSSNNTIIRNNMTNNSGGIGIRGGSIYSNKIILNEISGNGSGAGISIYDGSMLPSAGTLDHVISDNIICNNKIGIDLLAFDAGYIEVDIISSIIYDNEIGISLYDTGGVEQSTISNCTIEDNDIGILIYRVNNINKIFNNNLSYNREYAIYLNNSSNIQIYHNNFIKNGQGNTQVYDNSDANFWDDSYPSGGNFWSDYSGVDRYHGPNQNILGNDGIGDTPYIIDLDSQDNYPLKSPIGNCIYLYEGWNLVSIPFMQSETSFKTVLSPISGSHDAFQWFNTTDIFDYWKHNHESKSSLLNDLHEIDHTIGFWIHIIESGGVLFEYSGTQPTSNQTIQLHPDWNMVGYPSLTSYNRTEGLNNLTFGQEIDLIQWYDASTNTWHDMGEDDYFIPEKVYWIHDKTECVWKVPF